MTESENEAEDSEEEDELAAKRRKPKVQHKRQRWDIEEMKEINMYFQRFLDSKIVPRTKDVQHAQKKSKKTGGKIWMRTMDKIIKKISAMNHKK